MTENTSKGFFAMNALKNMVAGPNIGIRLLWYERGPSLSEELQRRMRKENDDE